MQFRASNAWATLLIGIVISTSWSTAAVWLSVDHTYGSGSGARLDSVLTTTATISAAAIVLMLTAGLIGLQMVSRYGWQASRLVIDRLSTTAVAVAALLGVALPVWAVVESSANLRLVAFAGFSWSIMALCIAGALTLGRLNPHWLCQRMVRPFLAEPQNYDDERFEDLRTTQAVLLEIAAGTDGSDPSWPKILKSIVFVGLLAHRTRSDRAPVVDIIAKLAAPTRAGGMPSGPITAMASAISVLALACGDPAIDQVAVGAIGELVQETLHLHRSDLTTDLLDELAAFSSRRLEVLLPSAGLEWLVAQTPILDEVPVLTLENSSEVIRYRPTWVRNDECPEWSSINAWLDLNDPPYQVDWLRLVVLMPPRLRPFETEPKAQVTLVEPRMWTVDDDKSAPLTGPVIVKISDLHDLSGLSHVEEEVPEARPSSKRGSSAFDVYAAGDLLDLTRATLEGACASPTPDDESWPGGWRGSNALQVDMARISSIGLCAYETMRYLPTDRIELCLERCAAKLLREPGSPSLSSVELPDVSGWRLGEQILDDSNPKAAAVELRKLALVAWRSGLDRRCLLTLRRLLSLVTLAVQTGDPNLTEDLTLELGQGVIHTAKWADDNLANQRRGQTMVLGLAVEFEALGHVMRAIENMEMWRVIWNVVETIAWSGPEVPGESLSDVHLHFLAGFDAEELSSDIRPWDVDGTNRRPSCGAGSLADRITVQFSRELELAATLDQPFAALGMMIPLWRDAILSNEEEKLSAIRDRLNETVIGRGRREFELPELWAPTGQFDSAPFSDGPRVHWRAFDVAKAFHNWIVDDRGADQPKRVALPTVKTPDLDLVKMALEVGVINLVNERQYWGVDVGDDALVVVEEADHSRRLLRDCESRARGQFAWGYGGSGPTALGQSLAMDALGVWAYCPSCFGTVGAGGGLLDCDVCGGEGFRPELFSFQRRCVFITSHLSRTPAPERMGVSAPQGAQWQIARTELLAEILKPDEDEPEPASS